MLLIADRIFGRHPSRLRAGGHERGATIDLLGAELEISTRRN